MDILFENPFDDFNANVLNAKQIMQYWYTPFGTGELKDLGERRFYTEKMPIILQGSRGTGKTTILKYFSFDVQTERALYEGHTLKNQVMEDQGVGFYFRCEDAFLKTFESVFKSATKEKWTVCFELYFELFFVHNLLLYLERVYQTESIRIGDLIVKRAHIEDFISDKEIQSLKQLQDYIDFELRYLNSFRNDYLFKHESFRPRNVWSFNSLSRRIISAIKETDPELEEITYLLLVDEFENFPRELQRMFNTMLKFCNPDISFRIGRRSERIVTTETINETEYLREEHDYSLISLDLWQNDIDSTRRYLAGLSEKRLKKIKDQKVADIKVILGDKEDLNSESAIVADDKCLHLKYILNVNPRLKKDTALLQKIITIISYPDNRIAESLNALWVASTPEDGDFVAAAYYTSDAMHAFFEKNNHPAAKKYADDYNNKYRYALTVLICVAYKKDKAYYGFNDLCYLSEGNARVFINLCKGIFNEALFCERDSFLTQSRVSRETQTKAIKRFSQNEYDSVFSIIQYGSEIRELIKSLGNTFSDFHKDRKVSYPETNQFYLPYYSLGEHEKDVFNIAESWALIIRKKETQRLSAGVAREGDIFRFNRIFAPIFNISYRTRGGYNVEFSAEDIKKMISGQYSDSKLSNRSGHRRRNSTKSNQEEICSDQFTLFEEA